MTSLDDLLKEKTVRQMAVAIVVVITAVVVAERALRSVTTGVVRAAPAVERSVPNILLITFDALSAEDMSVYGYQLPTTPRMDEFARKSTVFTNFFSASTFTTPSIGTILTGIYPSEHHVYGLKGHLSLADASRTLPHLLRTGKYSTGASMTNPAAYSLNAQLGAEYDVLLSPAYHTGAFMVAWNALALLHQQQPFGSRLEELDDLESVWDSGPLWLANYLPGQFRHTISRFPASGTFAQARELLNRLPGRFFLWVHVYAPHLPYLPDPPYLGRFLASNEMRTAEDQDMSHLYSPKMQGKIDKARLRYDEFLAEADQALGAFLDQAERAGRLRNTAVIISADHGESFQGGVYTHGTEDQVRPQIHIPLIIRMPEQKQGARIAFTADQTALAPTLLEMAGLPQPPYMRGKSLLPWLSRDGGGEGEGFAFTQYLEWNKVSEPLSNGTVGVISGGYQYILDLRTRKAQLRSLAEADRLDADRSAGNAGLTNKLLQAIYTRFPDLPRRSRSSNLNPRHE